MPPFSIETETIHSFMSALIIILKHTQKTETWMLRETHGGEKISPSVPEHTYVEDPLSYSGQPKGKICSLLGREGL